jgi:hypothetical protein
MKHEWPVVSAVSQCLIDGRARVARGWCQGRLRDENGGSCAIGALYSGSLSDRSLETFEAYCLLNDCLGGQVSAYNDLPSTTQADILSLYDRAIEKSRSD